MRDKRHAGTFPPANATGRSPHQLSNQVQLIKKKYKTLLYHHPPPPSNHTPAGTSAQEPGPSRCTCGTRQASWRLRGSGCRLGVLATTSSCTYSISISSDSLCHFVWTYSSDSGKSLHDPSPMHLSSPLPNMGFRRLPASIAPPLAPAPTTVWICSVKTNRQNVIKTQL